MEIITEKQILQTLNEGLINPPRAVIVDYEDFQVNYGFGTQPDFDYCAKHGIECVNIGRRGGTFVVNKGDIGVGIVEPALNNTKGYLIQDEFVKFLERKNLPVSVNGNDILIDGYKVYGWASNYYKEYDAIFISCHFTMSVDLDLIKNICTKPMNKIPKGLSDYGITREEIIKFLEDLL